MQHKNNVLGLSKLEISGNIMQSSNGPVIHLMFLMELS